MSRASVAILLTPDTNFDAISFKYFALSLNLAQTHYEFTFPDLQFPSTRPRQTLDKLFESFRDHAVRCEPLRPDYWILITSDPIPGNLFFEVRPNLGVITTDVWSRFWSPPSLYEYLLHCMVACLLFMHPSLKLDAHNDTRGCILDYTRIKADDRVDIALGYLCESDTQHIQGKLGLDFLREVQSLISRHWIGTIQEQGTVAFNLRHFFRFDITSDSGFKKTYWERAKARFDELPLEAVKIGIDGIIAILLALILFRLGLK